MDVEVRCCCNAGRLLGMIDLPEAAVRARAIIKFPLAGGGDLDLPLQRVTLSSGHSFMALKSNDTPMETLRRLPGFRERDERLCKPTPETVVNGEALGMRYDPEAEAFNKLMEVL